MAVQNENAVRKVDALGRLVIPKHLRDRFAWKENDEVEFFTARIDGEWYICLRDRNATLDPRYKEAALLLGELNIPIPNELKDIIRNADLLRK